MYFIIKAAFRKVVTAILAVSVGSLAGCNLTAPGITIGSVVQEISSGMSIPVADLGKACEVAAMAVGLAKSLESTGVIGGHTVDSAIAIGNAVVTNPACAAAVAGNVVADPVSLSLDIIQFMSAINAATHGLVTTTTATSSKAPQVVQARKALLHRAALARRH